MSGSVVDFKKAIEKRALTYREIQDARYIKDGIHNPNVYAKWIREDVVLAEFAKAEQQWQKVLDEKNDVIVALKEPYADEVKSHIWRAEALGCKLKLDLQKKQLQALINEFHRILHAKDICYTDLLEIEKKFVELNK